MMRFLPVLIFLALMLPAIARADTVVLLHGIARTSGTMTKMAQALVSKGYTSINVDYPSRENTIEELVEFLRKEIERHPEAKHGKINFIGHSMGGLLIRAYIKKYRPKNLGRVVMLGPPNGGSEVADFLKNNYFYKKFYGPAGQELTTDRVLFEKFYGTKINYDLGVIAGDWSVDPISTLFLLPGDDDGKVTIARTKINGMKDHIVVHATHTFIASNDEVIGQTIHFLEQGTFKRKP